MSIIQDLKNRNAELIREKKETEKDIAEVAKTFSDAWKSLGIDFSKMSKKVGEKPNMGDMTKIALSIGRKMISGQIKVSDLADKWDSITPILKKYEHVIEKR